MNDLKQELNEIMKEFNRHNLDAIVLMNYLENTQVLHIDTTRHDREIYNKAIDDFMEKIKRKYYGVHPDELYEKYYPREIVTAIEEIADELREDINK